MDIFKDRQDQSIGDPFWVNGAEFLSTALRFLSSSYPARHPEGDGWTRGGGCEEVAADRGGKKRTPVLQRCFTGQLSQSVSGLREKRQREKKTRLGDGIRVRFGEYSH